MKLAKFRFSDGQIGVGTGMAFAAKYKRSGQVVLCFFGEAAVNGKPAYQLEIDFGPGIGRKKSSAQITRHYQPAELIGRQVAAVVNFPPRQIGKMMSEVLTLGFPDEAGEVVLIMPERAVPNGGRLF